MTDPTSGLVPRCPWCSAALSAAGIEQCPTCGAQLVSRQGADTDIKGVTTLDAEAILRGRSESNRPRGGLLSLITGDEMEAASAREHQESLAQPSREVRREMERLEQESRQASEEAERNALRAALMAQLGITADDLAAAEAAAAAAVAGDAAVPVAGDAAAAVAPADAGAASANANAETEGGPNAEGEWPAELVPTEEAAAVPAELPAEEPGRES